MAITACKLSGRLLQVLFIDTMTSVVVYGQKPPQ